MKKLLCTLLFISLGVTCLNAQIVITEIMYNGPENGMDYSEFIELYNAGNSSVDMTGYNFTQGVTYTFGATTLNAGDYFVIAVSSTDIDNIFGAGTVDDEFASGGLSNGGEDIELVDAIGTVVDYVNYGNTAPWPSSANGQGSSLRLNNPLLDNSLPENWSASDESTGVFENTYEYKGTPGQNSNFPATHLNFDGVDDQIDLGASLSSQIDALNTITVEAWVKPNNNTAVEAIFGNYSYPSDNGQMQLLLRKQGDNYVFFVDDGNGFNSVTASNMVSINTWQHVTGVWDGSALMIYINGVLQGTTTNVNGASFGDSSNDFSIGYSYAGGGEIFNGDIDELRVWSTVRTATQLFGSKDCELSGNETGLLRYYNFNQGNDSVNNSGLTSLADASSSANNGTLINFALLGPSSNWLAGSNITTGSIVPSNPTVTTPVVYNQGDTATPLTATIGANGTGLLWYTVATEGTGSATAPTPSTAAVGNTSYWVSSTNANGCESERTEIVVQINAMPPPDAPTTNYTTQVYTGDDKTVADLQVTGTNIKWYDAATAGTLLSSTDILIDETTYHASQTIEGLESTERVAVTVNRISDNAQTFASGSTVADLVATPSTDTTAQWFTTASGGTALEDTDALANGTYYVEQFVPEVSVTTLVSGLTNDLVLRAVQSDGKVLFIDNSNNSINRMDADGTNIIELGSGFSNPVDLAVQSDGKILVLDSGNNTIKRMDADGTNIVTLGSGFNYSYGIAVQSDGKILITDGVSNTIKRMDANGTNIVTLAGGFNFPVQVAVQSDGKILVSDSSNYALKRMDADGSNIEVLASIPLPYDIAVQADGKIYVASGFGDLYRVDADGSNLENLDLGIDSPGAIARESDYKILGTNHNSENDYELILISLTTSTNRVPVTINLITDAPTTNYATQVYTGDDKTLAELQVTGTAIQWYDAATAGMLLSSTDVLADETTYYASQTVGGVESTERLAITVNRISDNAQTFDSASVNSIADLVATPSTGATSQWFTTASGGIALEGTTTLTSGTYYVEQFSLETATIITGLNQPIGITVQSDGKILMSELSGNIKRMDADGSNLETVASGFVAPLDVAVQSDGKILVADTFNNAVKLMNADGSSIINLGSSFDRPSSITVQPDGKILVSERSLGNIKRMDADGSFTEVLSNGFSIPSGTAVQTDNKILVVDNIGITRMDTDGSNGITLASGFSNELNDVKIQPDGRILLSDTHNGEIKRMDADGSNIQTLAIGFNSPQGLAIQPDGKILIADRDDGLIKRISDVSSNRVPVTINIVTDPPTTNYATQVYTGDDKTLASLQVTGDNIVWYDAQMAGNVLSNTTILVDETTYYASQTVEGLESSDRLAITVNRISDNSQEFVSGNTVADLVATPSTGATAYWFTSDTGGTVLESSYGLTNGTYYVEQSLAEVTTEALGSEFSNHKSLAVQLNGKILIAEYFNGVIKRMDADGSNIVTLSSEFNSPSAIAVQSDGKILVLEAGGSSIKRMNSDGTNIVMLGAGFNNPQDFAVQPDGKILILDGDYGNYLIKRMNADGTNIVTLLETGFFSSYISHIAVQSDGKILITDESNGTIIRMNADGSNMVTVFTESNTDNFVYDDLILTLDGKILFAQEDQFNGIYYINRMDLDGMNHESIVFGGLKDMALQPDGEILYIDFDTHVKRIISLATQSNRVPVTVDATLSTETFEIGELTIYPNPTTGVFNISTTENLNIKIYDVAGKLVFMQKITSGHSLIDIINLSSGMYILNAENDNNASKSYKIIKD